MRNQSREYRRRTGAKSPAIKAQESFTAQIVYKVRAILSPRDSLRYLPRAENKDRKRDSSVGKESATGKHKGSFSGKRKLETAKRNRGVLLFNTFLSRSAVPMPFAPPRNFASIALPLYTELYIPSFILARVPVS